MGRTYLFLRGIFPLPENAASGIPTAHPVTSRRRSRATASNTAPLPVPASFTVDRKGYLGGQGGDGDIISLPAQLE